MIYSNINKLNCCYIKHNGIFVNKKDIHGLYTHKPAIVYINSMLNKSNILKENKDKSGIYKWTFSIDNKSYIGSSTNITNRIRKYYCLNHITSKIIKSNSRIYRALYTHGHSNFNFEILEYCDRKSLINREQYYIDLLKPEYNICKTAGSMLGFKHTEKTILKFKTRKTCTGYVTVIINKENNIKKTYNSLRKAAKSLGTYHTTLKSYHNKNKLFNNLYYINIIN
jgi:excinuclease UvrABC nuclease subunit